MNRIEDELSIMSLTPGLVSVHQQSIANGYTGGLSEIQVDQRDTRLYADGPPIGFIQRTLPKPHRLI